MCLEYMKKLDITPSYLCYCERKLMSFSVLSHNTHLMKLACSTAITYSPSLHQVQ